MLQETIGIITTNQPTITKRRLLNIGNLLHQRLAENSHKAYNFDWTLFEAYCHAFNMKPLPADQLTVADFLSNVRTKKGEPYKPSSLSRFLISIRRRHQLSGFKDPTDTKAINNLMKGIRRAEKRSKKQAKAMKLKDIIKVCTNLNDKSTNKILRDTTLLLIGFGGAFRRSELAALNVSDIASTDYGLAITVRKSKTDQEGKGIIKSFVFGQLPYVCPVRVLKKYIETFDLLAHDPLFVQVSKGDIIKKNRLSGDGINGVVKSYFSDLSAHSMRAGFITETSRKGKSIPEIMQQTGHKTQAQVSEYIRLEKNIENNAVVGLF